MGWVDVQSFSLTVNLAIFAGAAVLVWISGNRLAAHADLVSERTGAGQALVGMLLLGVATSLPEVVTTITGAVIGNAALVTGNLFGGVAMQITVLAIVDLIAVRGALTYAAPRPILLFQGVMLMLMLGVALTGAIVRDPLALFGIGLTPVVLALLYVLAIRVASAEEYLPRWRPVGGVDVERPRNGDAEEQVAADGSTSGLAARIALAALGILAAGTALSLTGDALSEQTGLGSSFVGVALVAASTSLPELSTTLGSVRRGNVEMAVSNVLGTNLLEVALFLVADVAYRDGVILASTDRSGLFAGALGLVLTGILLLGLLERRNRTVSHMGVDSLAILVLYGIGLTGLYHLR